VIVTGGSASARESGMPSQRPRPTSEFAASAEWYLTVRCSNPTCTRLIAFQKTRFGRGNPNLRLAVIGNLSVACPHCKLLTRFQEEQIERRCVVLTH
jgi:hypothetical protein